MASNAPGTPTSVFCSKCGATVWSTDAFCPNCAAPQNHPGATYPAPPVSYVQPAARRYAGFWIRFVAIFIDGILINVVTSPVWMLNGLFMGRFEHNISGPADLAPVFSVLGLAVVIQFAASWLYEALMTSSSKQATVGKMVCGLIVTDTQGRRLSFAHATGRHFAKYVSSFTFMIGYIMAGFTERKQALHDFIAGTYVMYGKPQ